MPRIRPEQIQAGRPGAVISREITYKLKTDKVEPPEIKLRLKPLDQWALLDAASTDGEIRIGQLIIQAALEAVVAWDLEDQDGNPIAVTAENKRLYLQPLLGEELEGERPGELFGIRIVADARNRENFLKN